MRILIVSATFPPFVSGVATATANLASELTKRHSVTVITSRPSLRAWLKTRQSRALPTNPTVHHLAGVQLKPNTNLIVPYPHPRKIEAILENFRPDIIHLQDPSPLSLTSLALSRRRHIPVIATHHFTAELVLKWLVPSPTVSSRLSQSQALKKLIYRLVNLFYNRCDLITIPNPSLIPYFKTAKLKQPIISIPNGIDTRRFQTAPRVKSPLKRHKISHPIILFVGRLDIDKSLPLLIQAFAGVKAQTLSANLVLVGGGGQEKKLKRQVTKLNLKDSVHFVGKVDNRSLKLAKLYHQADIFASASMIENQSVAFLEAMAAGLPLVALDSELHRGFIKHRYHGLLFKPHHSSALAAALQKLISQPQLAQKLSNTNKKASKKYTIQSVARQYLKAYRSLLT